MPNLIGTAPNQTPTNGMLGTAAFIDAPQLPVSTATQAALDAKQATLVSGTNIKTLNGSSLLGSGDVALPSSALTLIATLTPTAAANVDALTVFSSTYDDYLISFAGLKPSSTQRLNVRFAVSGSVDSGTSYGFGSVGANLTLPNDNRFYVSNSDTDPVYQGCTGVINLRNVNSTTGMRHIDFISSTRNSAYHNFSSQQGVYTPASVISGIRFFWESGGNFAATGTIRIYGYSKT